MDSLSLSESGVGLFCVLISELIRFLLSSWFFVWVLINTFSFSSISNCEVTNGLLFFFI